MERYKCKVCGYISTTQILAILTMELILVPAFRIYLMTGFVLNVVLQRNSLRKFENFD